MALPFHLPPVVFEIVYSILNVEKEEPHTICKLLFPGGAVTLLNRIRLIFHLLGRAKDLIKQLANFFISGSLHPFFTG